MDNFIERLMLCGWRKDQAWILVSDFLRELDFDELEDFIRREECGLCG